MVSSKDLGDKAFQVWGDEEYCILGITGTVPEESKKYVMGNLFLSNFYTIFDAGSQRIGFSKKLAEPQMSKSTKTLLWVGLPLGIIVLSLISWKLWQCKKERDL